MQKKITAFLLTSFILISTFPVYVFAAQGDGAATDIGCYEYGYAGANTADNPHPSYPSSNYGGDGTAYYVSVSGNDAGGNGTPENPWRTLSYAASRVSAQGSVIHIWRRVPTTKPQKPTLRQASALRARETAPR